MYILGLDHIQIAMPVGAEEVARQFYGGVLGFAEIPKPAELAGRGGCWFEGASVQLHLGVESGFQPALKAHPAFLVADLGAARQALESAGIAIAPDNTAPGVRRFYAADPFGNRIEFIQHEDGFSVQRAVTAPSDAPPG